jgi:hypothetical protein
MAIHLLICYAINLFDLICTNYWISLYGLSVEGNPIGRWLYENGLAVQVKVFMVGTLLLVLYSNPKWKWTGWLLLVFYSILAIYHIILAIKEWFL